MNQTIGHPGLHHFRKIVESNSLLSCPTTYQDILSAEHFRLDTGSLNRKMVHDPIQINKAAFFFAILLCICFCAHKMALYLLPSARDYVNMGHNGQFEHLHGDLVALHIVLNSVISDVLAP